MKDLNKDEITVKIPDSTFKKLLPYILSVLISGTAVTGLAKVSLPSSTTYENLSAKYTNLEQRTSRLEDANVSIMSQLQDIKDQGKSNADLSTKILLLLSNKK
jgi:hypothetical protein